MRCKGRSLDPYQGEPARPLSPPSHGRLLSDSPYLCPGNTWRPGTCLYPDTGARAGATSDRRYSRQLKETPGVPPPAAPRLWPPPARPPAPARSRCVSVAPLLGRGWPHRAASPQLVLSGWPAVNQRQWPARWERWVRGGRGWRATTRWALRRGIKHAALANSGFMMWGQSRWGRGRGCCRRASCQLRWSLCYI